MSAIKEAVDKTVNMVMASGSSNNEHERTPKQLSSQGSITSTTSNLLKQNRENDSFEHLQEGAQQERNRLSDMLDSVRNSSEVTTNDDASFTDADEYIFNRSSNESLPEHHQDTTVQVTPEKQEEFIAPEGQVPNDQRFEFEVTQATPPRPRALQFTPDLGGSSQSVLASPSSAFNRRSIISDYAPSIHEVNTVAYVGQNQAQDYDDDEDSPVTATEVGDDKPKLSRKASVIKISRNSSKGSNKNDKHEKNKESINSFSSNTNSGSGSSKYPESTYSGKDYEFVEGEPLPNQQKQLQNEKILEESESTSSFEFNLGPLKTTKGQQEPLAMERTHVTSVDPSIPSRSKKRPVSSACISPPVNILKQEQEQQRPRSIDIGGIDNLMVELNREIYKSPNSKGESSQEAEFENVNEIHDNTHQRQESATSSITFEKGISKRPLPPPPVPKHEKNPIVTYEGDLLQEQLGGEQDQDYVTEEEEEDKETKSIKDTKKKHKRKSKNKKRQSSSSGFKKGHFNHETLAQLLQVTEGTIIGQEFQNIGLEPSEKQLLERLVDSLSRLTADMVIDADRHDESIRRLNKAIKALEGF